MGRPKGSGKGIRLRSQKPSRQFFCRREGCSKVFTREEHLQRHALNHTAGEYTCTRCRAHFKRSDLLDRHLERHRLRDIEVGAEGSGVLNTRKRSWKALDGTLVQKKPQLTGPASPAGTTRTASTAPSVTPPTSSETLKVTPPTTIPLTTTPPTSLAPEREWADQLILAAGHINTVHDPAVFVDATLSPPPTNTSSLSDPGRQSSTEGESYEASQYDSHTYLPSLEQHQLGDQQFTIPPFISVPAHVDSITGADAFSTANYHTANYQNTDYPNASYHTTSYGQRILPEQPSVDFLFDDVFQPDTASSFNMPYTTAINYNWLFNMDENDCNSTGVSEQQTSVYPVPTMHTLPYSSYGQEQHQLAVDQHQVTAHPLDYYVISPESALTSSQSMDFGGAQQDRMNVVSPPKMQLTPTSQHSVYELSRPPSDVATEPQPFQSHPSNHVPPQHHHHSFHDLPDLERPLSSIQPPSNLPVIDRETRERLLQVVDACHPALPDGQLSTWEHPLLAMAPLQEFCDLFFTRFNSAYPLLHQATFQPATTEPLLMLAVLLLGTTYSSKEAHQLAVCIHDVMRPCIFSHTDFGARPKLWMLQTILLVECFGKSRAGQKQHDMSHLFHGLLINLIRRSDCQSARAIVPTLTEEEDNSSVDKKWRAWSTEEEMKRLALLCFMWDTQHAVLFCQSLCMSAFELRLTMPCSQQLWEAQTAAAWKDVIAQQRPGHDMFFLTALKMYLTAAPPSKSVALPQLNALSRVLLLHGLLSISWDMQRRDQTALGVVGNAVVGVGGGSSVMGGGGHWSERMSEAYDRWMVDFDAYCAEMAQRQQRQLEARQAGQGVDAVLAAHWKKADRENATFNTAYKAVYHAAHVLLNTDFLDVQIYAGARHILGRPVQRADFLRSERIIKQWTAGDAAASASTSASAATTTAIVTSSHDSNRSSSPGAAAAKAAWHAACLVHDAAQHLDDFDAMGLFHVPWCLYLATLTCWVFHHTRPAGHSWMDDSGEIVWDARQEMDTLVSSMAATPVSQLLHTQGRYKTGGLVWVMANVLSNVRWGIVHAGVVVLRGLVPLRMINQYEGL
ncbi:hypothetical protein SEPCBS57363_003848 [Sporothrix epigloea]|uniref:C2H2-type domain-containing protein n=1 Tax=Sporothrix epigloea TaxID=1892477 RepID=A0ABP0DNS3_9PEZI